MPEYIGGGDRPIFGGGDRPIIGGGNRPNIGSGNINNIINNNQNWLNQNNINWNNTNINVNRPGWGWGGGGGWGSPGWGWSGGGWGRPGWGWGANQWAGAWYNRYVPPVYHGWYHGCWNNSWANAWSIPLAFGTSIWALNSLSSWTSGYYSASYLNPYYVAPVATVPVYDYSQPIVVQTYLTADPGQAPANADAAPAEPQLTPEQQQAYQLFDQARAAFANNDNGRALSQIEEALRLTPGDPIMHEFRALCLFALGDYRNAAAVLNALLAVAPGWDWTTMSSLYKNTTYYTDQLRNLESYCRQNPNDPASHFVLAYHYLILGHDDSAVRALEVVTTQQPEDVVASRMLEALTGPAEPPASSTPAPADAQAAAPAPVAEPAPAPAAPANAEAEANAEANAEADADADAPATDLVGQWRAEPNDQVRFELTIDEEGNFSWVVTPKEGEATTLTGPYGIDGDTLILRSEEQGDLIGQAISGGPDRFTFRPIGAPPNDPGLIFDRVAGDATP